LIDGQRSDERGPETSISFAAEMPIGIRSAP